MEAMKAHHLQSASERPKIAVASGLNSGLGRPENHRSQQNKSWSESEGLRTRSVDIHGQEKMNVPGQVES